MNANSHHSQIIEDFLQLADSIELPEKSIQFSSFCAILPDDYINLNPDEFWTKDEFVNLAVDESWNADEFSEEGYIALKRLFYRLIVPKEHWEDCTYDKFLKLTKQKYMEMNIESD